MPELDFKGKEFVRNHHLTVPFRPLIPDPSKSIGEPDLDGNLVIHGDNLEALKSLLPMYAGKVDCIFIDPPYNTGNEGWSYNDNVNSPILKAWFSENPVGLDDTLRHDKWCAMMWPRLRLLWELLAPGGSIWITLDDNEAAAARLILDELFTESNFIATIVWHKMDSPKNTAQFFSEDHDYILVYAKNKPDLNIGLVPRTEQMIARYQNPDGDPRGPWLLGDLAARNFYSQGLYEIVTPSGRRIAGPPSGSYWRVSEAKLRALDEDNRLYYGPNGDSRPGLKRFLSEVREGVVPQTIWHWEEVGSTRNAKQGLQPILAKEGEQEIFITPKPVQLVEKVLQLCTTPDSIILDSFAGSGTTGHAVLRANTRDGGSRRFILVECEEYADSLTAERVRRVINGYPFKGTQRETLYEQKLNFSSLKRADELLADATNVAELNNGAFDKIETKVEAGVLRVTGIRSVDEM
ncbi:MAG TPA: site-specific DNA-methyltransferase, partial [Fimbriimonas sp.]|nr:site-specific DNA-methyltransferase [Fimbriimonas sp.]